jgi:hypothetical protein
MPLPLCFTLHFYYWYFPILWGHYLLQLLKYNVIWRLFCFFTKRINQLLGSLLLFNKLWVFLLLFFSKNWWKLMVWFFSSEGMGAGPSINSLVRLSFCFLSRRGMMPFGRRVVSGFFKNLLWKSDGGP